MMDGRRVGQAIMEVQEYHSGIPPEPWFRIQDNRTIGYKLELDAEKPRDT